MSYIEKPTNDGPPKPTFLEVSMENNLVFRKHNSWKSKQPPFSNRVGWFTSFTIFEKVRFIIMTWVTTCHAMVERINTKHIQFHELQIRSVSIIRIPSYVVMSLKQTTFLGEANRFKKRQRSHHLDVHGS